MAPRLIPPLPELRSSAEQTLWRSLKAQLPPNALLAANVHLHSHEDFYEADLIVGLPGQGFAVIEVKGGRVQFYDGSWHQPTPDGMRRIDPAGQADRAKRMLDKMVRAQGWRHGAIRFEHLVAFPDADFGAEQPSPDLARWALIAKGDLERASECVWNALDKRITDFARPTADMVDEFADLLSGRPNPMVARLGVAQAREEHVNLLTEQQYAILRAFRRNSCVSAVGGPGTGKTWLALEQARVWAADGKQVLFVCYSHGLARWLRHAVGEFGGKVSDLITVARFDELGAQWGIEPPELADGLWYEHTLPELMLNRAGLSYDALVVDEGQDFFDSWWPPLLATLRHERIFVAGDVQQSVFAGRQGRPDVHMTELSLDENLRNTKQIAAVFGSLASNRMTFRGGEGTPVQFIQCTSELAQEQADQVVDRLLQQGHPPSSIAVLTTLSRHNLHRSAEVQLGKDGYWDGFWMDGEVFYGTVMGFKGLERPTIVLAVDGFRADVARDVMYVGLSRARDQLFVCGDLDVIDSAVGSEVARRLSAR